jgi:hypothetical protein
MWVTVLAWAVGSLVVSVGVGFVLHVGGGGS